MWNFMTFEHLIFQHKDQELYFTISKNLTHVLHGFINNKLNTKAQYYC